MTGGNAALYDSLKGIKQMGVRYMKYSILGTTGMEVSNLCFGTMSFGGRADKDMSRAMYQSCRDAGINFFDCANVYQKGVAEEYLGEFIAGERQELVITTKGYGSMKSDGSGAGCSRKHLLTSLEDSLKRLKTDYVDIYFVHHFDPKVSMEELISTLDHIVKSGKALSVGLSNFAAWQVQKMVSLAQLHSYLPVQCLQPMYNIAQRQAEVELLPMALEEKIGVITYSPLGGGLLSGRYGKGKKPEKGRLVENASYIERYRGEFYEQVATSFADYAASRDLNPVSLALAWVASHPAVTAPIIGAANLDQLKDSLASVDITIDEQMAADIDAISPPPPLATDRSEEAR